MSLCTNTINGTVGLDTDKQYLHFEICPPHDGAPTRGKIPRSVDEYEQLWQLLEKHGALGYCVTYEAGRDGYSLARKLQRGGICGHVIDGGSLDHGPRGRKSNGIDAGLIATQTKRSGIREVAVPEEVIEDGQKLCRTIDRLLRRRSGAQLWITSLLRNQGISIPDGMTPWTNEFSHWISSLQFGGSGMSFSLSASLLEIARVDQLLEVAEYEVRKSLQTPLHSRFYGLIRPLVRNPVDGLILATELHSPHRFEHGSQIRAFGGFDTTEAHSGRKISRRRITGRGNPSLNQAAFQIASHFVDRKGDIDLRPLAALNDPLAVYVRGAAEDMMAKLLAMVHDEKHPKVIKCALAGIFLESLLPILKACYPRIIDITPASIDIN